MAFARTNGDGFVLGEQILQKSAALMRQHGIEAIDLADIARECKISKELLCSVFPSKDDIIFEIAEREIYTISEAILEWVEQVKNLVTPERIFQEIYERLLSNPWRSKLHVYLVARSILDGNDLKEDYRNVYRRWRLQIEQSLTKVLHAEIDFRIFSQMILASIDGFIIQNLLGVDDIRSEEIAGFVFGGI